MRTVGDPEADAAYREVLADGAARTMLARLDALERNDTPLPPELSPGIRDLLSRASAPPAWAGAGTILEGQKLLARHGLHVIVALTCASLPTCYAAADGANVLALAQRMYGRTRRRIVETAHFVLEVMEPGAFEPQGRGVRVAQRVRLVHAALRHHLSSHAEYAAEWGVPINQEDLVGTLMTFSVVVTGALRKLGVAVGAREEEAYLHAWKVVASFLGIRPELLPEDVDDGRALMAAIGRRHFRASRAGRVLTEALIACLVDLLPAPLAKLPPSVMRELLGDEVAEMLGVPSGGWASAMLAPIRLAGRIGEKVYDRSTSVVEVSSMLGRRMLRSLHERELDGDRPSFRIPTSLSSHWRIATSDEE